MSVELLCGIFALAGIAVGVVAHWAMSRAAGGKGKPASMSNHQLVVALLLSVGSLLFVGLHLRWPEVVPLDSGTLALLALAVLPWLTLFVKSAEVAGLGKLESRDNKEQGTASPIAPAPAAVQTATLATLSPEAKKVLATLWRYQRATFGTDKTRRWTFAVQPFASEFPTYLLGVADAVRRGLVVVAPDTHQCMLTNDGLAFVEKDGSLGDEADHYHF